MKKFLSLYLCLLLTAAMLAGCGQSSQAPSAPAPSAPASSAPASSAPSSSAAAPAPAPAPAAPSAAAPAGDRADAAIAWQYKTADETKAMLDKKEKVILLDSRQEEVYLKGHIPAAYHVPCFPVDTPALEKVLTDAVPNLQGDAPIVIVCKTGNKGAKRAISVLQDAGIAAERLFILEGGGDGWKFPELTTTEKDSVVPAK